MNIDGVSYNVWISIHALLAESDGLSCDGRRYDFDFYPRSPCGERPRAKSDQRHSPDNFYPRSPCGERLDDILAGVNELLISIHALLAESDNLEANHAQDILISIHALLAESDSSDYYDRLCYEISIHALLAESDLTRIAYEASKAGFLSTLSLRRATAKVHKTVGHFCAYETNFMEIASSC